MRSGSVVVANTRSGIAGVATAAAITVLDGFDAFSLSLMAPHMRADLHIPTASLGTMFSSAIAGMIFGAAAGGILADRLGRPRVLMLALALFGVAGLVLPLGTEFTEIVVNRLIAGIGLGAAAPIAVALLNAPDENPPSELTVAFVWAGIPVGGMLAALYNLTLVPVIGWRSMFVVGGALPFAVMAIVFVVFRKDRPVRVDSARATPPRASDLFAPGQALRTVATAAMFFFGYITTSIIVNWLPTILAHRSASSLVISASFAAINGGGVLGILILGLIAARRKWRHLLLLTWAAAALCGFATLIDGLGTLGIALFAIGGATLGASAQSLSVALANGLHGERGLEGTSVGLMAGTGRIGQASALAASGLVIGLGGTETLVFALAGAGALLAALFAVAASRPVPRRNRSDSRRTIEQGNDG